MFGSLENVLDGPFLERFKNMLGTWAKKWCFQLEKCPTTGRLHYQGRLSLKVKLQKSAIIKAIEPTWNICWSVEQNESASSLYVTKEDSRIDGPWSDKDVPTYIPRALRTLELKGWQPTLRDILLKPGGDRVIHLVLDEAGGIGKSTLAKYMFVNHGAIILPGSIGSAENLMKLVCNSLKGIHPSKHVVFFLDLPRAVKKNNWEDWCTTMEQIRGGHITDWRYGGENRLIEPPSVCCFTNSLPPVDAFTSDRWQIHRPSRYTDSVAPSSLLRSSSRSMSISSRSSSQMSTQIEVIDLSQD